MILKAKNYLPQPKLRALVRRDLVDIVKNRRDKKLFLLIAGAGCGKTTLLGQLAKEGSLSHVYCAIDDCDSDLATFFGGLVRGMELLDPNLPIRSAGLLKLGSDVCYNHELLMGTLINELCEKWKGELYIFLDDFHNISENSPVHRALDYFIDHLPGTTHVVVASQTEVRFPNYAKWYAKQDVWKITADHLSFTVKDLKSLAGKMLLRPLSRDEYQRILNQTEGWIAGILLILWRLNLGRRKISFKDILPDIHESGQSFFQRLCREWFMGLATDERALLSGSSILESVVPAICDVLMGTGGSSEKLKKMERNHPFIFKSDENEYRYHSLLRAFLQQQITGEDERKELHIKAAGCCRKIGLRQQEIAHLLEAGRFDLAAEVIIAVSQKMFAQSRILELTGFIRRIPESIINDQAELLLVKATLRVECDCYKEAYNLYLLAERASGLDKGKTDSERRSLYSTALLGQAKILQKGLEYEKSIKLLDKALRKCPNADHHMKGNIFNSLALAWQSLGEREKSEYYLQQALDKALLIGDQHNQLVVECNRAFQYQKTGNIRKASELYRSLFDKVAVNYFSGASNYFMNAAGAAMLMGEFFWSEHCLDTGRKLAATYNESISKAKFDNIQGLLDAFRGRWQKAFYLIDGARKSFEELELLEGEIISLRNISRLYRYQGQSETAAKYLETAMHRCPAGESNIGLTLLVEKVQVWIERGLLSPAAGEIRSGYRRSRQRGLRFEFFQLCLADAKLHLKQGNIRRSSVLLKQALKYSREYGYDGLLVRELASCPELSGLSFGSGPEKDYLCSIRSKIAMDDDSKSASSYGKW